MATETIFQNWLFTQFILPFFLIFFIVFGVLEKTKIFGDNTKKLNALVSFVIGLIFVGAIFPKLVVGNLILFLSVALVVLFITLILWTFAAGEKIELGKGPVKYIIGIVVIIAVVIAVLWATGVHFSLFDALFHQSWSSSFWTNFVFVVLVIGALVAVLAGGKGGH